MVAKKGTVKAPKKNPSSPPQNPPQKKLTGLQRLKKRKLRRLEKDGQIRLSDRDLSLLFNELGFPGGIKVEGKIGVKSYTEEEDWKPGFYIWELNHPWKLVLENHEQGGIHFFDISDTPAPQNLARQLVEKAFTKWLGDFFSLKNPLHLSVTPDGKLAIIPSRKNHLPLSRKLRLLSDQITQDGQVFLNHQDLQDLLVQAGLPNYRKIKASQLRVVVAKISQETSLQITWGNHQLTLVRPAWGGIQATHHRGNRNIEAQFSGAYFFNWLGQVLEVNGDVWAEITDDGRLKVERR